MSGRPWYSFYPDAYERDAGNLTYVQDSAYRRMLDQYYKTGEALPIDHDTIYRSCRAMRREERQAIDYCLGRFFDRRDDGYHNARADAEISRADDISTKRAAAASKRHAKAHAIAPANAEDLQSKSTHILHSTATTTELSLRDSIGGSQAKPPKATKARRGIPEDFPGEPDWEWAQRLWLAKGRADLCEGIADQVAQFRDHHAQHGKRMADWPAAWRTWARNALDFTRAPRASNAFEKPEWKPLKVVGE